MLNKKFKKKWNIVLISTLLVTLLAGCGNNKSDDSNTTTTDTAANEATTVEPDNSDTTTETTPEENTFTVNIGDYVTYGKYEQDNDLSNGPEPIKWQVMDIDGENAFLVSRYILDKMEYNGHVGINGNKSLEDRPWIECDLYSWLHNEFAVTAFTDEELSIITDTTDYTNENSEIKGSIFLLSYEEVLKYFNTDTVAFEGANNIYDCTYSHELLCKATPYAVKTRKLKSEELTTEFINKWTEKGFNLSSYIAGEKYAAYWLRSSLSWDSWFTAEGHAMFVQADGITKVNVASLENIKTKDYGVRPCLWINLKDAEKYLEIVDRAEEEWFSTTSSNNNTTESETEDCTWEIVGNKLIITGKIPNEWKSENTPWAEYKDTIEEVEIINAPKIYSDFLRDYTTIKKITLDDTVERIGNRAFDGCSPELVIIYMGNEYTADTIEDAVENK